MPHNQSRKYRFTIYETDDNGNKVVGPDGKHVVKEKGEGNVTVSLPGKNDNDYDGAFSAIEKKLGADFRKTVVKTYWDKALTNAANADRPTSGARGTALISKERRSELADAVKTGKVQGADVQAKIDKAIADILTQAN
tara:strand:+ start:74 stop:487 length:414 start_codon:yes stop_codon:yes gene_type:complete